VNAECPRQFTASAEAATWHRQQGADCLAPGPGDQLGQDPDAHAGVKKVHGTVGEHGAGAAGVKAVDFGLVRAVVDGTGAGNRSTVRPGAAEKSGRAGARGYDP
jgi:hypothetical protein